jgi:hypothetical protein
MSAQHHCPYRQSTPLQQALAPDKMRIAFLFGAGCPVSIRVPGDDGDDKALIPDIRGLTALVKSKMGQDEGQKQSYAALLRRCDGSASEPTIERKRYLFLSELIIRVLNAREIEKCSGAFSCTFVNNPTNWATVGFGGGWRRCT